MTDRTPLILNTSEKRIEQVQSADTIYVPKDLKVYSGINCATVDDTNTLNTGYYARTDFFRGKLGNFFAATSESGGTVSLVSVDPSSNNGSMTYLKLTTGTNGEGSCSSIYSEDIYLKNTFAEYELGMRLCVDSLSVENQDYFIILGLRSCTTTCYNWDTDIIFYYDRYNLVNANWYSITYSGGNYTAENTNVAVSTSWQNLKILYDRNNSAPRVRFYINGSLVATHTTNVPDSVSLHPSIIINKRIGTTSREVRIDYIYLKITYLNRQTRF